MKANAAVKSLPEFARQAGLQILAPADKLKGVVLPAIKGLYDVREALKLLLAGSNLEVVSDNGEIVTLRVATKKAATSGDALPPMPAEPSRDNRGPPSPRLLEYFDPQDLVVTGSRIIRDGYEAPTPVTVVGLEQIQDAGKANIADVLNQLPMFQNSATPRTTSAQNDGRSGGNNLNLRNLDANRTLVMFDGRRIVPAFITGLVDINLFPDALISRVDVVTGGASAVYGSDAVAGVVNLVLDTSFVGVKGLAQGGVTERGDGRNYKLSLAAGTGFADDRGHFLIQGDMSHQDLIDGTARDWNTKGSYIIPNPNYTATNGAPQLIQPLQVGLSEGYPGGIITGGPLKGIAFGPGGQPFTYDYGKYVSGSYNVGGDWRSSTEAGAASLIVGSNALHLFTHASYDISDDIQIFAQFNHGGIKTRSRCCFVYYLGNLTVHPDNPFMPDWVAAQAHALGLDSIPFGTTLRSDPRGFGVVAHRLSNIYVLGAKGKLSAGGAGWSWDAYLQRGISKQSFWVPYQPTTEKFFEAIDAVRSPTGSIVCRSSLTNPNNGCAPYNLFGTDVVSQEAFNYVMDGPRLSQTISQNVAGANIMGEPFSTWAGGISVALSAEYRKDAVRGRNDPYSPTRGWYSTQLNGFDASQSVVEGAVEAVIPLAKNQPWVEALDINAAVRVTDYSAVGFVSTWKVGATYQPADDLRFRLTQSRDIRAPNLNDLFSTPQTNHATIPDPFRGNVSYPYFNTARGNPNLRPEKADTTGIGLVYQPSWSPRLNASVDYYRINIKGAIVRSPFTYILNQCYAGVQSYCDDVTRFPDGTLNTIFTRPHNQNKLLSKGIDFEASYQTPLADVVASWDGVLGMRVVATHVLNLITDTGIAGPTQVLDGAGYAATPKWGVNASFVYNLDNTRITWTSRYVSPTKISNMLFECAGGCITPAGLVSVDNQSAGAYVQHNLSINYTFYEDSADTADVFLTIDNLFDKDPPLAPAQIAGATYALATNAALYDTLGRAFRAGIRFKM